MLALQEAHTSKANAMLKQIFMVKIKAIGGKPMIESLSLQPVIKQGGITGLNTMVQKVRTMLLEYYLKSEALYIKGVLLLNQNEKFWKVV
jgi:hypothetical protein